MCGDQDLASVLSHKLVRPTYTQGTSASALHPRRAAIGEFASRLLSQHFTILTSTIESKDEPFRWPHVQASSTHSSRKSNLGFKRTQSKTVSRTSQYHG